MRDTLLFRSSSDRLGTNYLKLLPNDILSKINPCAIMLTEMGLYEKFGLYCKHSQGDTLT
jgi:hypothetical protein